MILIRNISKCGNKCKDHNGNHLYELRINKKLITTFEHKRSDGLAQCLYRAAEAVIRDRLLNMIQVFGEYNEKNKSKISSRSK